MRTSIKHSRQEHKKASTNDVLGQRPRPERIDPRWKMHYQHLVELRDYLLRRQNLLSKDAIDGQPNFSTHMADAGTDTYDRDLALGMLSSEQDSLYEIDEALERIREGTYGICELTGKKIEIARLDAIPWTRFTAEAESQLEKEGEIKRTRLGPRDTVEKSTPGEQEDDDEV